MTEGMGSVRMREGMGSVQGKGGDERTDNELRKANRNSG